jgi:hypothetical protein
MSFPRGSCRNYQFIPSVRNFIYFTAKWPLAWGESKNAEEEPRLPITVRTVELSELPSLSRVLSWFLSHKSLPLFSTLVLDYISGEEIHLSAIGAYLRKTGEILQHLTMRAIPKGAFLSEHIDLRHNTALRTLDIYIWHLSIRTAFRLVSQITSPCVEEIDFAAWYPTEDTEDEELWSELDTLLASPRFLAESLAFP